MPHRQLPMPGGGMIVVALMAYLGGEMLMHGDLPAQLVCRGLGGATENRSGGAPMFSRAAVAVTPA